MEKTKEIIQKDIREVLDKYLADKLAYDIEHEIMALIEWDLAHMEDEDNGGGS